MRSRRRAAWLCLAVLLPCFASLAVAGDHEDYETAITTIRCDCGCHPQSVKDCACGRAAEMREEIAAMVEGGPGSGGAPMTADEIIARYVAAQGEDILIAPSKSGFNLLAWLGPLVALALGIVAAGGLVRRWVRHVPAAAANGGDVATPAAEQNPEDERYREELRRRVAEWDS